MQPRKIILLCILLFISSCGSGGDSSRPDERKTGTISGVVYYSAAVNEGAKVTVSELKDNGLLGRTLGSAVTNARGEYSVEVKTASMPLHIVVRGGTYKDYFTPENGVKQAQDGSDLTLEAYINFTEGENRSLMLTPLSNMASGLIEYRIYEGKSVIKEIINNSFADVNAVYGFDVARIRPVDITRGIHSDHATLGHQYGALLRAYSSYAHEQLIVNSGDKGNQDTYTAYNLFNIQYRDIKSTAVLDGRELNGDGLETGISFGGVTVNTGIYAHEIAQHLLRVAYDPVINKSKIPGKGFEPLAEKINNSSDNNVFPMRKVEPLDSKAPLVTRHGRKTLVGEDEISLQVDDYIGIQSIDVELQYNNEAGWSELIECNVEEQPSDFCSVTAEIEPGIRNIDSYPVKINTKALDTVAATEVKLIVVTTDVIDNTNLGNPKEISFQWNNIKPVITVGSLHSFHPRNENNYVLKGTVKTIEFAISSFGIQMGSGDLDKTIICSPLNHADPMVKECEFSSTYASGDFNEGETIFRIEAESENHQLTVSTYSVYTNTIEPGKEMHFPEVAVRFITQGEGGERQKSEGVLSAVTFEDVPEDTPKWLNIESQYARQSLKELFPTMDFSDFNPGDIPEYVPYITVTVTDRSGNQEAEMLKLIVDYEATKEGSETKLSGRAISTARDCAESDRSCLAMAHKIPHENTAGLDGKRIIYYIPFTRDIFGSDFQKVTEGHTQAIRIRVEDESGNVSKTATYAFNSTFDLPLIKLHTPFIGAKANFYRLGDSLNSIGTCITSSDGGALDLAQCEVNSQYTNEVIKVSLSGKADFYQWSKHEHVDIIFDSDTQMTGYFFLDGSKDVYLTELSVFQSGFFDYLWDNADPKSKVFAKQTLDAVNSIFKDPGFFGFTPILTGYATTKDLDNRISSQPGSEFQHRFLLEAMNVMAEDGHLLNSLDLANKFYVDFKSDGQPDGIGSDNEVIYFGEKALSAETYRAELAKHYYDFVFGSYNDRIADHMIMAFADKYAKANPNLNGKALFADEGASSDTTIPDVSLEVVDGKVINTEGIRFINDAIEIEIRIKDPSGIDNDKTNIEFSWINDKGERNPENLILTESGGNTKFDKTYRISFDPTEYPKIIQLDVAVQAVDVHGNNHRVTTPFKVDNDAPVYDYIAPFGDAASDTYINLNAKQELKFKISDAVGEKADVRKFILQKGTEEVIFDIADMGTSHEFVILTLCKESVCGEDSRELKDGEWLLYVEGEDLLGNKLSINNLNITPIQVNIDSTAPIINASNNVDPKAPIINASDKVALLGGNQSWLASDVINYGGGSAAGPMMIRFFRGNGSGELLEKCDGLQCLDKPAYLIGENEKTVVKLVAKNIIIKDEDEEYRFEITAEDTAFRPNIGTGSFRFKVDQAGPAVTLGEPVISPVTKDGSYYIVGKEFSINIKQIVDASDVGTLSVWQKLEGGELKLLKESSLPKDLTKPFQINLIENDTNKIQLGDNATKLTLVVKSTDEYGFSGQSNDIPVKFYKKGPSISLTNYSKDDFYAPNYSFKVAVTDQANQPVVNDGVKYWIYTGDAPAAGEEGKQLNAEKTISTDLTESFYIKLEAVDIRGNISDDVIFPVQVNSLPPQGTLSMEYQSDSKPIMGNQTITEKGNVRLKLKIDGSGDRSGVSEVKATLAPTGGDIKKTYQFAQKNGDWEAVLLGDDIDKDGNYNFTIDMYNKTKTNNGVGRQHTSNTNTLTVQRDGYHLKVMEPEHFANHIANNSLKVKFAVEGHDKDKDKAKLKHFECWLVDNYNEGSEGSKLGDSKYYVSQSNTIEPICDLGSIKENFTHPSIITRTERENGASEVDQFTFRQVDVGTPVIQNKDNYLFTNDSVGYDDSDVKQLVLNITVTDDFSGINTAKLPTLKKGLTSFPGKEISSSSDNKSVTYQFAEEYTELINKNEVKHNLLLEGIVDLAGNAIADKTITLNIPNQKPIVEITGLKNGQFIDGGTAALNFGIRMKLASVSKINDIELKLLNTKYTVKMNPKNFGQLAPCGTEDDPWNCKSFVGVTIPTDFNLTGVKVKKLPVTVEVTDYWGNKGESKLDLNVVKSVPEILKNHTIEKQGDKLVVTFNIRPNMSGLSEVNYIVRGLGEEYSVKKTENFNMLEIDAVSAQEHGDFSIEVQATDNAGLRATDIFDLDITKAKVTLSLDNTKLAGGVLVLDDKNQVVTLTSERGENSVVNLESYKLILEPTPDGIEKFELSGDVSENQVKRPINFTEPQQGKYQLKLIVTDHIGREITDFIYDGKEYDGSGIPVIVDFNKPEILSITPGHQGATPNAQGFYPLDVSVSVKDPNLDSVTVDLTGNDNSAINQSHSTYSVQDNGVYVYVFSFDAKPGEYAIKVTAHDLAEHPSGKPSNIKVIASPTPELKITKNDAQLGSEKMLKLTFTFTEDVKDFDVSDVDITSTNRSSKEIIKDLKHAGKQSKVWTASYITPTGVDDTITFKVEKGSYKSLHEIPGIGDETSIDVFGSALTVKVSFEDPSSPVVAGQVVPVDFVFDRDVDTFINEMVVATLINNDGEDVEVSSNKLKLHREDLKHWSGNYTVPAEAAGKQLFLTVKDYHDVYANTGITISSPTLTVAPEATIKSISGCDGTIGGGAICQLTIEFSADISTFNDGAVTINNGNGTLGMPASVTASSWTVSYTAASAVNEDVIVKVDGSKLDTVSGVKVAGVKEHAITIIGSAPTAIMSLADSLSPIIAGQEVALNVDFSRKVDEFTPGMVSVGGATLDSSHIELKRTSEHSTTWTATYSVPDDAAGTSLNLTVAGYQDDYGNIGLAGKSLTLDVAPEATIKSISGCDGTIGGGAICQLTIEFSADISTFNDGAVTINKGAGTLDKPERATGAGDNRWTVNYTASYVDEDVTVILDGSKLDTESGVKVAGTEKAIIKIIGSPLTVDAKFVGEPSTVVAGQELPITFDFNRAVPDFASSIITAKVGDNAVELVDLKLTHPGLDTQSWAGTYAVPASAAGKTINFTVGGYKDVYGNSGAEGNLTLTVAPEATIESITLCDDIASHGGIGSGASCDLIIKFSEPVGLPSQAAIFIKAGSGTLGTPTPGFDNSWTVSYTAATGKNETATIQVLGDELKTKLGARVVGDKVVDISVIGSAPTVNINFDNPPVRVRAGNKIAVTFEFSRSVPIFDAAMVTEKEEFESYGQQALLTGLASTDLQQKIWTATYTVPNSAKGKTLLLTAEGYKDKYGNTGTAGSSGSLTISRYEIH